MRLSAKQMIYCLSFYHILQCLPDLALLNSLAEAKRKQLGVNRVIVYIWTSKYNTGGKPFAGHVAVEITRNDERGTREKNTYISLWPAHNDGRPPPYLVTNKQWSLTEDYAGDRLLEEREPEFIFCFYTLETSNIVDIFKSFTNNPDGAWDLFGQYFPKTSSQNVNYEKEIANKHQSCVSLSCLALDAGGINRLLTNVDVVIASSEQQSVAWQKSPAEVFSKYKIIPPLVENSVLMAEGMSAICGYVISPDILIGRLKKAKIKEWKDSDMVRQMGRMIFTTNINEDGSQRSTSFSFQDPHLNTQNANNKDQIIIVDERTYEWLPIDEENGFHNVVFLVFLIIGLSTSFLYYYLKHL